jgi:hypothetical protein
MIRAVREGALIARELGELTAVCSVGLRLGRGPPGKHALHPRRSRGSFADQMADTGMINGKERPPCA